MPVLEITEEGLRALDFTPQIPCSQPGCGGIAVKVARCRRYASAARIICEEHLAVLLAWVAECIADGDAIACAHCPDFGPRLEDVAELVDL